MPAKGEAVLPSVAGTSVAVAFTIAACGQTTPTWVVDVVVLVTTVVVVDSSTTPVVVVVALIVVPVGWVVVVVVGSGAQRQSAVHSCPAAHPMPLSQASPAPGSMT